MTPDLAQKAVQFLIDTAAEYGAARADAIKADDMLRVVKSLIMAQSLESSVSARETEAYGSKAYRDAIEAKFQAVKAAEVLRARRDGAIHTIEVWRSLNSNLRSAERGFGSAG